MVGVYVDVTVLLYAEFIAMVLNVGYRYYCSVQQSEKVIDVRVYSCTYAFPEF